MFHSAEYSWPPHSKPFGTGFKYARVWYTCSSADSFCVHHLHVTLKLPAQFSVLKIGSNCHFKFNLLGQTILLRLNSSTITNTQYNCPFPRYFKARLLNILNGFRGIIKMKKYQQINLISLNIREEWNSLSAFHNRLLSFEGGTVLAC